DALGRTTSYTFDGIGDVLTTTNPSGQITTSQYDNDGHEIRRSYSNAIHPVTETYNRAGLRVSMTDGTGTSTWTWNSLGLQTSQHQAGGTVRYRYDLDAHLTGLTYPSGRTVTRTYGADGELAQVRDPLGAKTSFNYNRDGMLVTIHAPDRLTTTYAYNDLDELTKITVAGAHGRVASMSYTLNADDQVTSERSVGLHAARQTYSYDSLGRLQAADGVSLRYDAAENLTRTSAGAVQSFNADDEITKQVVKTGHSGYTYNVEGSRTLAKRSEPTGTVRYGFDQEQELTSYSVAPSASSAGRSVSYSYDGDGLRQSMTVNGAKAKRHAVQGQKRLLTYDTVEGLPLILTDGVNSYVYGPGATPLEQINGKTKAVTYLTSDILGSVRLLANDAGKVVGTANYGPAGLSSTTGSASTPFGFAGQYRDPVSGLLWMRSRYYDPSTGQFITADPAAPVTLAPYQYANNDPVNLSDPSGLASA